MKLLIRKEIHEFDGKKIWHSGNNFNSQVVACICEMHRITYLYKLFYKFKWNFYLYNIDYNIKLKNKGYINKKALIFGKQHDIICNTMQDLSMSQMRAIN